MRHGRGKTRIETHVSQQAPLLHTHSALAPLVANAFHELQVSVALHAEGEWHPMHWVPNITSFEIEHQVDSRRWSYNTRCIHRVARENKLVVGEHAGFYDLFAPVPTGAGVGGVLVAGPVAQSRASGADILQRWRRLASARGRPSDPGLAEYVGATLATLTLEGSLFEDFKALMSCLALLMGGQGPGLQLAGEAAGLRRNLTQARFADRMSEEARTMVDDRSWTQSGTLVNMGALHRFGLKRPPQHVVVGLLLGRGDNVDLIDDLLRRDAFQRACVELARRVGRVVTTRLGDHGVALLVDARSGVQRSRLVDLGERTAAIAKAHGFSLHLGLSRPGGSAPLPTRYRAALAAAETALSRGVPIVDTDAGAAQATRVLYDLRRRLGQAVGEPANVLVLRFVQYLETAAVHSAYRLEPTRAHLEAGFERIVEALSAASVFDERRLTEIWDNLDRTARDASTVRELGAAYRGAVTDIARFMVEPTGARQVRGMRRAVAFIRDHLNEPLTLGKVARIAGFAPGYFSKLLKREQDVSFEQYTRQLRVERAKQMLATTSLTVARVGGLCGFGTPNYFHQAFKHLQGVTPLAYRHRAQLDRAKELLRVTAENVERVADLSGFSSTERLRRAFARSLGVTPLQYRARVQKIRTARSFKRIRKS
jgi:AraC-like DNA-binding protein